MLIDISASFKEHMARCRDARSRADDVIRPVRDAIDTLAQGDPTEAWYLATELHDRLGVIEAELEKRCNQ